MRSVLRRPIWVNKQEAAMAIKWIVGTTRGATWVLHPDSPWFNTEAEADAWARNYLTDHPDAIEKGVTGLTPKRMLTTARA
jgi:hypothetical protein